MLWWVGSLPPNQQVGQVGGSPPGPPVKPCPSPGLNPHLIFCVPQQSPGAPISPVSLPPSQVVLAVAVPLAAFAVFLITSGRRRTPAGLLAPLHAKKTEDGVPVALPRS